MLHVHSIPFVRFEPDVLNELILDMLKDFNFFPFLIISHLKRLHSSTYEGMGEYMLTGDGQIGQKSSNSSLHLFPRVIILQYVRKMYFLVQKRVAFIVKA